MGVSTGARIDREEYRAMLAKALMAILVTAGLIFFAIVGYWAFKMAHVVIPTMIFIFLVLIAREFLVRKRA